MRILNFGSLNIDHVYRVERLVRPGETITSETYQRFCGGKGSNQSIALARAGAQVYHAGKIGEDGIWIRDELLRNGVHTQYLEVVRAPSGHAIIQVDRSGENAIVLYGGTNRTITRDRIDQVVKNFGSDDLLLLQNEISEVGYAIEAAKKRGVPIFLNPAPMTDELQSYPLEQVDCLVLNEIEGATLAGEGEPEAIVARLSDRYPDTAIVLTLGRNGVRFKRGSIEESVPAFEVETIDTTGAGDAFLGYFLAALAAKKSYPEALREGAAAGALSVTRMGAADSIPRREDVDRFLKTAR